MSKYSDYLNAPNKYATALTPQPPQPLSPSTTALMDNVTPDDAAESQRLSGTFDVPADVTRRNLPELRSRESANKYQRFLDENPTLSNLGDEFHTVAHDAPDELSRISLYAKNVGAAGVRAAGSTAGIFRSVEEGFLFAETVLRGTSDGLFGTDFGPPDETGGRFARTAQQLGVWQEAANALADRMTEQNKQLGTTEQGVLSGIQSLTQNVPLIAGAVLTRSPQLALTGMSGLVFGESYGEARSAGLSALEAARYGTTQAAVEYVTEKIPVGKLFGDLASGSGLIKTVLTQLATEIPGEQVATILQDLDEFVTLHPERTLGDYIDARPAAAYQTLVATIVATGAQTTSIYAMDRLFTERAANANEDADMLKELAALVEASKLKARSPEQLKRMIETVAPDTELYVDPADIEEALQQSANELPADIAERVAEAAESNTPVRLSTAEFAAHFSDTAEFLASRVRVGAADALNVEEAKQIEEEFAARAERVITDSERATQMRTEAAQINDQIREQITSTGRFRNDVAKGYASLVENFFVTMAGRTGVSPLELFNRYPLRIQAAQDTVAPESNTFDQLPAEAFKIKPGYTDTEQMIQVTDPKTGREAGYMMIDEFDDSTRQIKLVQVAEDQRGQGIGQQLVIMAYEAAQAEGKRLVSDRAVSALQLRVYEALRRRGWTIRYTDPAAVQRTLELADRVEKERGGKGLGSLGTTVGLGESVVKSIEAPALAQSIAPEALSPVAMLADTAGETPAGFTRFRHFGNYDVPAIDPGFQGTGMRGAERLRSGPQVTSLYPDTGFQRESGVGPVEYVVDVPTDKLYDADADPLNLADQAQVASSFTYDPETGKRTPVNTRFDFGKYEQLIKDAGYEGYVTPNGEGNFRGQGRLFYPVPVVGAPTSPVEQADALFQLKPEHEPQGYAALKPHLTPEERARVMKSTATKLVNVFSSLPKDVDFADAAKAGKAKRGWYAAAVRALRQVFGDVDAPRFAGLLAATSPQVSVETNLANAVKIWAAWDQAGRPTDDAAINEVIDAALGGAKSVLPAWRNNSVRALSAEDQYNIKLSGPKVNSFMRNLMGDVQEVTNDTWMANFAAINQTVFSGSVKDPAKQGSGKRPGYVAYAAKIRRVAAKLSKDARKDSDRQVISILEESEAQSGPFDGGCLIYAKALIHANNGGKLVRIDSTVNGRQAEHYGVLLRGHIMDFGGTYTSPEDWIAAFEKREKTGRELAYAEGLDEESDIPQDPRAEKKLAQVLQKAPEPWTPAEVQETIWSWAKTAYELAEAAGETRSVEEIVRAGVITDAHITGTADFASLLKNNASIRSILEAAGYGEAINAIEEEFGRESGADTESAPVTPALLRSARRLDEVRRQRKEASNTIQGEDEVASPLEGTYLNIGLAVPDGTMNTPEQVLDVLDELEAKIESSTVQESNTEPTVIVKLTSPLSASEMNALSEMLKQEAVVQMTDGAGELYGPKAAEWGPFNPEFFLMPDGRTAQDSAINALNQNTTTKARGQITMGRDMQVTTSVITLFEGADLSTFLHESGHFFFEIMADLAARPGAPAAIVGDMQKLLDWVGFTGTVQEWRAKSIPERRIAHEQFARGFEAFLLEGSAPSAELRTLFHRFRAWLIGVYKTVKNLNVQLTDEVRSVMSAMLATQEEIKAAEQARNYEPLFSAPTDSMTPEEYARYQETAALATDAAEDQLNTRSLRNLRWLDNARAKELKKLQAENKAKREAVRAEVEAEVAREPIRVAETLILEGRAWTLDSEGTPTEVILEGPHKLSRAALAEDYGTAEENRALAEDAGFVAPAGAPWQRLPRNMLAEDGLRADEVAALVGLSSGDQLINELLDMQPRESLIEDLTDQRMIERYGDLTNPQIVARTVDLAVHNQFRTRTVAMELAALDASLKVSPGGINAVRRAARDFAAKVVQRKKIRDVRPSQFTAAEAKAARESQRALAAGNLKLAAARKRDQLFNGYASRDANKAMDVVEKGLRYLKGFNNTATRKTLDPGYRDQIDMLLERFDLRKSSLKQVDKRTALAEWIKEQEAEGNDPVISDELRDTANRTNYQNLTVEQFTALVDAVKNIEHFARMKKRLLAAKEQRDFERAVDELVTSIDLNATGPMRDALEQDLSLWGRVRDTVTDWLTHLRKMASVSRQIDGGKDGGKFWSYFMRPINDAADMELRMRTEATQRLNALFDTVPGLNPGVAENAKQRVTGLPKLFIQSIKQSLSLQARLSVALNWGNEGNRQRIMEGNKWTEQQVQDIIDTLSKEEMDFVQKTFDLISEYWPQIAAKEERVTGVRPLKVESIPITTKHGQYPGGYYPIVADPKRSDKAAQQNDAELISQSLRGAVSRATTRRGHTKARVGGKDPVRLDLNVITQHISQVIHDLAWHEVLIDSGRLLRDKRVSGSLRGYYGAEITRLMRKTLDDVARGEVVAADAGERMANYFRVGATIAGMGLSVTTALLQPTGVTQSFVRVGYTHMARGLLEFMHSPVKSIERVRAASSFMRDRGQLLNRELGEITNRIGVKRGALSRFYFMPIQALQTGVDIPTWIAAYGKAVQQNEPHDRAVALADQAVRDSQSSGATHDLAEAQRGGAWKKLFTNFYSYFSATYQLSAESVQQFKRDKTTVGALKMTADFIMLYTVPAMLGMLIRDGLRGDLWDDEPDEVLAALMREQLAYMIGVFPYFRELGSAFAGFEYRGPAGASFLSYGTQVIKQASQGEIDEPLLRAANRAAGTALHYPAAQVDRTVRGIIAVAEGDAPPQAILIGPPRKDK